MDVRCPHCGAAYDIEENERGCRACCELCGKWFVIGHTAHLGKLLRNVSREGNSPVSTTGGTSQRNGQKDSSWKWVGYVLAACVMSIKPISGCVKNIELEKQIQELKNRKYEAEARLEKRKKELREAAKAKTKEQQLFQNRERIAVNKKELSGTEGFTETEGKSREVHVASVIDGNPLHKFRFGESGNNSSMRLTGFHGFEKITLGYTSQKRLFSICLTANKSSDYMVRALMKECDLCYPSLRWNVDTNYKGELFASGRRRDSYGRVELLVSIIPLHEYENDVRIQANIFDYCVKRIDDGDT